MGAVPDFVDDVAHAHDEVKAEVHLEHVPLGDDLRVDFLLQVVLDGLRQRLDDLDGLLVDEGLLHVAGVQKVVVYLDLQPPIDVSLAHVLVQDRVLLFVPDVLLVELLQDYPDFVDVIGEDPAPYHHRKDQEQHLGRVLRRDVPVPHRHRGHCAPVERVHVPDLHRVAGYIGHVVVRQPCLFPLVEPLKRGRG